MVDSVARGRIGPLELVVVAAAGAAVLAQGCVLATSFGVGLVREVHTALTSDSGCGAGMNTALTSEGEVTCISPSTTLPKGWVIVATGTPAQD